MRPALTYHGGKQTIAKRIVGLIPEHTTYVEPFCGGAAVLFAKPISKVEVINDTFDHLVTFYRVLQDDDMRESLLRRLEFTPFAESEKRRAMGILKSDEPHDDVTRAWAMFTATMQGFGHSPLSGWARGRDKRDLNFFHSKSEQLPICAKRIRHAQIWASDAQTVIPYFDSPETFFYVDPPYIGTGCGHYKGYTPDDYQALLDMLNGIQGKFILSGYPNDYADAMGFHTHDIECVMGINNTKGNGALKKTERLWANFELKQQLTLFEVSA